MTLSRQTLDFIRDHAHEDIHALALQTPKYPDVDMPAAILQIAVLILYKKQRKKNPLPIKFLRGQLSKGFYILVIFQWNNALPKQQHSTKPLC